MPAPRILSIDLARGIAVMGILVINICGFALPPEAQFNPLAYGTNSLGDWLTWGIAYLLFDGTMRPLFGALFGASLVLAMDRDPSGPATRRHVYRMGWLFLFGVLHYYLIWWGDVLASYAVAGVVAWQFRAIKPRPLLIGVSALALLQAALWGYLSLGLPNEPAAPATYYASNADSLGLYQSGFWTIVQYRLTSASGTFLLGIFLYCFETLGLMLLGMAIVHTGLFGHRLSIRHALFLTLACMAVGLCIYSISACHQIAAAFSPRSMAIGVALTSFARPLLVIALCAAAAVAARSRCHVWLWIAATGRMTLTLYLASSLIMGFVFYGYGLGLIGSFSRSDLWWFVLPGWALMMSASALCLRYSRVGPMEALWRTLIDLSTAGKRQ